MYALNGLCMHSVVVIKLCLISQFEATTPDCYQGCLQSLINDCGNHDERHERGSLSDVWFDNVCGVTMYVVAVVVTIYGGGDNLCGMRH